MVKDHHAYLDDEERRLWCEFVLHGLAEHSRIGREQLQGSVRFGDLFNSMLSGTLGDEGEE